MELDKVFTLNEYKSYLLKNDYTEELATVVVNLKIKYSVLGILGKDDKPASKKKLVVKDLLSHLDSCMLI